MKTKKGIILVLLFAFFSIAISSCRSGYQPVGCPKFSVSTEIQNQVEKMIEEVVSVH